MTFSFRRYQAYQGPDVVAAQVSEQNIETIQKHWTKEPVRPGDFVALAGNGETRIYSELDFGEVYYRHGNPFKA